MNLPINWQSEGNKIDVLVFQKNFKIYRGRVNPQTRRVSEEECFGVLCYTAKPSPLLLANDAERQALQQAFAGISGVITEIVAPILSRRWASEVIDLLEQGKFRASYLSCLAIEDELRQRGYDGGTLCPFHTADIIGFQIMRGISSLTVEQIEEFACTEGRIERYLTRRGYHWLPRYNTWRDTNGNLWNRHSQDWDVAAMLLPLPNHFGTLYRGMHKG